MENLKTAHQSDRHAEGPRATQQLARGSQTKYRVAQDSNGFTAAAW